MPKLIPPDKNQCQVEKPNPDWSPFRLGPCEKMIRCSNKPTYIATEKRKGKDGKRGSMSICEECADVLERQMPGLADLSSISSMILRRYKFEVYTFMQGSFEVDGTAYCKTKPITERRAHELARRECKKVRGRVACYRMIGPLD